MPIDTGVCTSTHERSGYVTDTALYIYDEKRCTLAVDETIVLTMCLCLFYKYIYTVIGWHWVSHAACSN